MPRKANRSPSIDALTEHLSTVKDIADVVAGPYGQPMGTVHVTSKAREKAPLTSKTGSLCLQVLGQKAGLAMFSLTIIAQFFMGQGLVNKFPSHALPQNKTSQNVGLTRIRFPLLTAAPSPPHELSTPTPATAPCLAAAG